MEWLSLGMTGRPIKRRAVLKIKQAGREMDTALRQLLSSLCDNSVWIYAVFWKLKNHDNEMLLTWEDGYFDYSKPREAAESLSDDLWLYSDHETRISGRCPVELAVDEMLSVRYTLGEGGIGEVALAGTPCWVNLENIIFGGFDSSLNPQCPDEWFFQFGAGIKTILLVPVVPHGVLQLGSLEMVEENLALLAYIEDKCSAFQNQSPSSFSIHSTSVQPSPSLISLLMDGARNSLGTGNDIFGKMQRDYIKGEPTNNQLPLISRGTPLFNFQSSVPEAADMLPDSFQVRTENENDNPAMSSIKLEEPESFNKDMETDLSSRNMNSFIYSNELEHLFADSIDADEWSLSNIYKFSLSCELHRACGSTLEAQSNGCLMNSSIYEKSLRSISSKICFDDLMDHSVPTAREFTGFPAQNHLDRDVQSVCEPVKLSPEDMDAENLLEAIVSNTIISSDDTLSSTSNCIGSKCTDSFEYFGPESQPKCQLEKDTSRGNISVSRKRVTSAFDSVSRDVSAAPNSPSSFQTMMSNLSEEQLQNDGYMESSTEPRLTAIKKRRSKPTDSQKRRPRDRQLIQDRVKELRELVPNGDKCSIDGLLDRTIKHMLFLSGVTEQAGKLKQWIRQEISSTGETKSSGRETTCKNGTSWAIELGSEVDVCPIIVEDLERPGHMLIEMLCKDHDLFLEIAQVICELDLTILKGSMKSRSNNTWAQYIVEVSKGFHRMDIFWPLMRLLQRNKSSLPSKI